MPSLGKGHRRPVGLLAALVCTVALAGAAAQDSKKAEEKKTTRPLVIAPRKPAGPTAQQKTAADKGTLREVWATGTAAVISPVGELAYKGRRLVVNEGRIGDLAQKLYDTIVAIQYGTAPDPHGWTVVV